MSPSICILDIPASNLAGKNNFDPRNDYKTRICTSSIANFNLIKWNHTITIDLINVPTQLPAIWEKMCLSKTLSTSHENNFIVPFIYLKQNTQTICCFLARSQLNILGPILSTADSSWDGQRVQKHDTFRTPPPLYLLFLYPTATRVSSAAKKPNLLLSNTSLLCSKPPQQHESPLRQRN